MASKTNKAIKISRKHLLGIQDLSVSDINIILDEAQNTTPAQMKMFLTRMGMNAKFMVTGDPGQVDLPKKENSGLREAIKILSNKRGIKIIYLDDKDVIRHPIVKKVIDAYNNVEKDN